MREMSQLWANEWSTGVERSSTHDGVEEMRLASLLFWEGRAGAPEGWSGSGGSRHRGQGLAIEGDIWTERAEWFRWELVSI